MAFAGAAGGRLDDMFVLAGLGLAAARSVSHSPCWKTWMRARHSGLESVRSPGAVGTKGSMLLWFQLRIVLLRCAPVLGEKLLENAPAGRMAELGTSRICFGGLSSDR